MKKHPNIILALILIALLGLGSLVGSNVRHLRSSKAFYQWILAAGTNMRMEWQDSGEYADDELLRSVNDACVAFLPDVEQPETTPDAPAPLAISQVVGDLSNDTLLWNLARGPVLKTQRDEFLAYCQDKKLLFAKDIDYAEAQASGVNVFNLFFGFRKLAASFVWVQVDRYWHKGMLYRMLPLMKTVVTLDPNFIDAYLVGAWHLAYNATAKMQNTPQPLKTWSTEYQACVGEKERYYYMAIDYLKDGIRKNPRNFKLYFDLGFGVYKIKMKDYANAVKYLSEAVRQPHERWVPRQLFICQELDHQYEEAKAGWEDYIKRYPDSVSGDEVAPRFIKRNEGMIAEQKMREALKKAEQSATPEESAKWKQEAETQKQLALQIWNEMNPNESDPFAAARIKRLRAEELAQEKRYHEACALLELARFESNAIWDEASNLIIQYKQEGEIPLSLSEKKAVLRNQAGDTCQGKPAV